MTILLLNYYFKIKSWIYRGILGVLVKKSLNLILFLPIPPNFREMKIWDFKGIENNECFILPILFPPIKTPKKGNELFILSIKTPKQGKGRIFESYSFHSFPFYSIPSSQTRPQTQIWQTRVPSNKETQVSSSINPYWLEFECIKLVFQPKLDFDKLEFQKNVLYN